MSKANHFATLFKYKAWANDEMLAAIRLFGEAHAAERRTAIYILNHTHVVDRIFAAHLEGLAHRYTATTASENPSLEDLSSAVKVSDEWYVNYIAGLPPEKFEEVVDFDFTDGDPGRMSRAEILTHLALHGAYHRGAIGRIMAQVSIDPPRDVLAGYLHKAEPAARRRRV